MQHALKTCESKLPVTSYIALFHYVNSYEMMLQCWDSTPDKRPSFNTLYMDTSKFIEEIAGYLEMGFNPFSGLNNAVPEEEEEDECTAHSSEADDGDDNDLDPSVTVDIIPPSTDSGDEIPE